jgi:predicted alpha/beta hydrolase family esterase
VAASHSPGPVYLDGVLSRAIDWRALGGQEQAEGLRTVLGAASALRYEPMPHHRQAVVVAAVADGFVPLDATRRLAEHWDAELRLLPGGHATALWRHRPSMAQAVVDSFQRLSAID